MKRKTFSASIKAMDDKGSGRAVFATTGVWDLDTEWTLPNAFGEQTAKLMGAHNWGVPNIGMVKIHEEGNQAIADFQFYLDMSSAKEWYLAVKNNFDRGVPTELSYGFDVTEEERGEHDGRTGRVLKKVKVHEVSFVVVGAGIGTRVAAIKSYGQLRGTWESTQMAIREAAHNQVIGSRDGWLSIEGTYDDAVVVCAYIDGEGTKYYQLTWSLQPSGEVLLSDQAEVDLEMIVREKSFPIEAQFARVADEVLAFKQRCDALHALRIKEGRTLSRASRARLTSLASILGQVVESGGKALTDINGFLQETDVDSGSETAKAMQVLRDFQRTRARQHLR